MRGFGFKKKKKQEGEVETPAPKKNKYGAKRVEYDGMVFASKLEANRYRFLKWQQDCGVISNLQCQVEYELLPNIYEEKVIHLKTKDKIKKFVSQRRVIYTPDFVYTKNSNGEQVVEEVKGSLFAISRDYPLRVKMLRYFHGIKAKVVTRATQPIEID